MTVFVVFRVDTFKISMLCKTCCEYQMMSSEIAGGLSPMPFGLRLKFI